MTNTRGAVRLAASGTEIVIDGPPYLDVLARLHDRLRPRTYLEIGTRYGESLRLARCDSVAVDPMFQLDEGVIGQKPACFLYQMTSDQFFASHQPTTVLGAPTELSFIDGYHNFEYALRDFIGIERSCRPESMIVVDDCCPRDFDMTRRSLVPGAKFERDWTGDVWKIVPVLREYRPEIQLITLDTQPTGLVVCTNLDPQDVTISDAYDSIVARWRDVTLESYGMGRLLDDLRVVESESWLTSVAPLHAEDAEPRVETGPAIGRAGQEVQALRNEVRILKNEVRHLGSQLDAYRSSTSWRVTGPLRRLGATARRVRTRLPGIGR